MEQHGDAATETTSVLSKPLLTAHCQRHLALHHCADPDQFPTTGRTSVDSFSHRVQIGIGRYACMVLSPSHAKLSACVQSIKAATTRHGSTWISSTGATLGHSNVNMIETFPSKSALRRVSTASRKSESATSRATIRSLHERATICTCVSPFYENLYILMK